MGKKQTDKQIKDIQRSVESRPDWMKNTLTCNGDYGVTDDHMVKLRTRDKKESSSWLLDSMEEARKEVNSWPQWMRDVMNVPSTPKKEKKISKKQLIKNLSVSFHQHFNPGEDPFDDGSGYEPWKGYLEEAEVAYKFFMNMKKDNS